MQYRKDNYDVTNLIQVSDPRSVEREVCRLLRALYPGADLKPVRKGFDTFTRIYAGTLPGYQGCDTWYHDVQHSLDCTLAMARLIDGHERSAARRDTLGARRAQLGVICALFHDVGYIRRDAEADVVRSGSELTLRHVTRGGEFLADFLPAIGYARDVSMVQQLLHYTGYEVPLKDIKVHDPKDRRLGYLLGSADLMAQMADRAYPEKCRTFLYREFEACGLAGDKKPGQPDPVYTSPEDLLVKTPQFVRKVFSERLDGYFEGAYHLLEDHFGGTNPYLSEIRRHIDYIRQAVDSGELERLRRKPEVVNAETLREVVATRPRGRARGRPTRRKRARAAG